MNKYVKYKIYYKTSQDSEEYCVILKPTRGSENKFAQVVLDRIESLVSSGSIITGIVGCRGLTITGIVNCGK